MICGVIVLSLSSVFIISNRCSSWYFRLRCAVSENGEEKNILDKFVPVTFKRLGDQTKQSTVLFGVCSNHSSCVCVGTNWEHQVFARRTEHVDADRCLTDRTNRLITNKAKVWQNTKQITFFFSLGSYPGVYLQDTKTFSLPCWNIRTVRVKLLIVVINLRWLITFF